MGRRGNKRIHNFEEDCNQVRLQLMYLDEVNETGHELTKLQHKSDLHAGDDFQVRRKQEMVNFTEQNGFFFYTGVEEHKLSRMSPTAKAETEQSDLEDELDQQACSEAKLAK